MRRRLAALALLALLSASCAASGTSANRPIPGMEADRRTEQINTTSPHLESR